MNYEPEKRYSDYVGINDELDEDDRNFMLDTGLKDKNGKGIYEGDIVKGRVTDKRCIDGHMIVEKERISNDFTDVYGYDTLCELGEVIGNIYETPNFLNKDK